MIIPISRECVNTSIIQSVPKTPPNFSCTSESDSWLTALQPGEIVITWCPPAREFPTKLETKTCENDTQVDKRVQNFDFEQLPARTHRLGGNQ